jgi:hypothetical protein
VDTVAPDTLLDAGPAVLGSDNTPTFAPRATDDDAAFECSVDQAPFASCASPFTPGPLQDGQHTFAVRAKDAAGNVDPTPASVTFGIDTTPPDTVVDSGPPAQVHGGTITFAIRASEPGTTECALDEKPYGSCAPLDANSLALGDHVFRARATDRAGNTDPSPAESRFSVVNAPPQATLDVGRAEATVAATDADGDALTYTLDFGDGGHSEGSLPAGPIAHVYRGPGDYTATLTVSDGRAATTVTKAVPVPFTLPSPTLALSLATTEAELGTFRPRTAADYTTAVVATTTVPAAGASLTVNDPSPTAPGHLVNGTSALPQPLQVASAATAFTPLDHGPVNLITFTQPATGEPNEIHFKQSIGATDPLRAGRYEKAITFTLTITQP